MKTITVFTILSLLTFSGATYSQSAWLNELNLSAMQASWGTSQANKSVDGNPLTVAGKIYTHGVGTHSVSKMLIDLKESALKFHAMVGLDDETCDQGTIEFFVMADKKILWQSGIMKKGDPVKPVDLDLHGYKKLALYVSDAGDNINCDHADWLEAYIKYSGKKPEAAIQPGQNPYILTPPAAESPRINGPAIFGASPNKPFLFKIPVTGARPMNISAQNLPAGLSIDPITGILSGVTPLYGEFVIKVAAENSLGKSTRDIKLILGDKLSLTPPMGWNSWNCWGLSVDQDKVRAAADAMVKTGLIEHGWTFINIDDGWEAPERTASGELLANDKFPDMKGLADYIHNLGLKQGIYSSPGTKTCGGYLASWQHEKQDAQTWSDWGIDYLKYDWCSYNDIAPDHSLSELQKPYVLMKDILKNLNRDIVFSLCQYGMGDVWKWGECVGGNLWRTTGDITDNWASLSEIGFNQDSCAVYGGPGHWNDPDMLVVGRVGWGPDLRESRLTPDEQYTHISLWCLLSAPLLLGCDLNQLDPFTLNLLTNDEILAIDQDPLGKPARRVVKGEDYEIWAKDLADGSKAVGFFNTGSTSSLDIFNWDGTPLSKTINIYWKDLGLQGALNVRDLWRQADLGRFTDYFETSVPYHGVVMIKIEK